MRSAKLFIVSMAIVISMCVGSFTGKCYAQNVAEESSEQAVLSQGENSAQKYQNESTIENIFVYPDWVLAGEEPPEGYEIVDGEIVGEESADEEVALLATETIDSSIYYINNKLYGEYIYNGDDGYGTRSGLIETYGTKIKWIAFYYEDKGYLSRNAANGSVLLSVPENTSSSVVQAEHLGAATYPPRFYWDISIGANGGCIFRSAYNGGYLCTDGTTLYTTPTLGTAGTTDYYSKTWRLASYTYYGNTADFEKRELEAAFTIDTLPLKTGLSKTPQINLSPSNALWSNPEDFNFSVSSSNVTANNTTHKITGNSIGTVTVTATHKVTGRTKTFKAVVCAYEATVKNYYDHGFGVFYESNSETRTPGEIISDYTYQVSLVLAEQVSLYLNFGVPQYFQSAIDTCKGTVTKDNLDTLCTHSGTKHTDRDEVLDDIGSYTTGNIKTTVVYWTNHKIKSIASDGTTDYNRSCSSGYYVLLLENGNNLYDREQCATGTLIHELLHQYGAQDHYHEIDANGNCKFPDVCSKCNSNERPDTCIMCNSKGAINNRYILCSQCKTEIISHMGSHHTY